MPYARTAALLLGVLAAICGAGCGSHDHQEPVIVPSDVHLASAGAAPVSPGSGLSVAGGPRAGRPDVAGSDVVWPPEADASSADRLEAARTVALYCRLIEAGQLARAGELCTRRRLWSRRAFGAVSRLHFRSARVYAAPDARTLVLRARVRVHAGRGCPLPDGLAILFFTLGRVGSAVGGWIVTAISTSP